MIQAELRHLQNAVAGSLDASLLLLVRELVHFSCSVSSHYAKWHERFRIVEEALVNITP